MATKRSFVSRKAKKATKKSKAAKRVKTRQVRKKVEAKKPPVTPVQVMQRLPNVEPPARERPVMTIDNIRGDTAIGDLLVTFPRTRDVLVRKGLRLEAEDAGDIYMTLDAFSAMNGIKTDSLVQEIVEVAKEPPPQPVTQVIAPTVA